jgi:hypothetical protein
MRALEEAAQLVRFALDVDRANTAVGDVMHRRVTMVVRYALLA